MGGACGTYRERKGPQRIVVVKPKEVDQFEFVSVEGR